MKKMTKLSFCLVVGATMVQGCGTRIDQSTRTQIAHTYALALTDSRAFFAYVKANPGLFAKGSKWDKAVNRLGGMLVKAGVKAIPDSALQESVHNIASNAGRPDLGPDIVAGMKKRAADLVTMGRMLQSLPAIVDGVAHGDATAYQQSMFGLSASVLDATKAHLLPNDWVALKKLSYQANAWMMQQYAQQL